MPHSRSGFPLRGIRVLFLMALVLPSLRSDPTVARREYVSYETFDEWRSLTPEATNARACGLTAAAHKLWASGQLRVPASTFLRGDFSGTGREDWAVSFASDERATPCALVLIVTRDGEGWKRLFSQEVGQLDQAKGFALLWSAREKAIGIDYGERAREAGAATIASKDGKAVEARHGYVVEKAIIRESVRWSRSRGSYGYRMVEVAEEWILDQC